MADKYKIEIKEISKLDIEQQKEGRQELQQLLIHLTEEKVLERGLDKSLDRENEIIQLIGGGEITIGEIKRREGVMAKNLQEYFPQYPKEYYREVNRLNGWTKSDDLLFQKPPIVGRYTNEIIYARFSKDVLPLLQHLNPYTSWGARPHKHFQWLNEEGKEKLQEYISDAIQVMKTCNTWYDFRVKHSTQFGVPFQLNAFIENEKNKG